MGTDIKQGVLAAITLGLLLVVSGCEKPPQIETNTPGFVEYKIDGDMINLRINSLAASCTLIRTVGGWFQEWTITKDRYGCIRHPADGVIEIYNDREYFRLDTDEL